MSVLLVSVKHPLTSVTVPIFASLNLTVAPGRGSPSVSITIPVIVSIDLGAAGTGAAPLLPAEYAWIAPGINPIRMRAIAIALGELQIPPGFVKKCKHFFGDELLIM